MFSFVAQAATGFYGAKAPQAFYCIAKKSKQTCDDLALKR
jgi:hypothetical protein